MTYGEATLRAAHAVEVLILAAQYDLVDADCDSVGELDSEVGELLLVVQLGLHGACSSG